MKSRSKSIEELMTYYMLKQINPNRDIQRVAKRVLNKAEYTIIAHRLGLQSYEELTGKEMSQRLGLSTNELRRVEEIACYKIIEGFENQDKLEEKLRGQFIRCPDCSGLINYKDIEKYTVRPPEELMEMNLYQFLKERTKIIDGGEGVMFEVFADRLCTGRSYERKQKYVEPIKKLRDLYNLTENQIKEFHSSKKIWTLFNEILAKNNLPPIHLPYTMYTVVYQKKSHQGQKE